MAQFECSNIRNFTSGFKNDREKNSWSKFGWEVIYRGLTSSLKSLEKNMRLFTAVTIIQENPKQYISPAIKDLKYDFCKKRHSPIPTHFFLLRCC